jgi:hypothetical protein
MRLCLIIFGAALAACGPDPVPVVPPDMLAPCPGWQGRTPATEGELIRAGAAEKAGRQCANLKLAGVAEILVGPQ